MKLSKIIFSVLAIYLLLGCADKIDPEVDTVYLKGGDYESRKAEAVLRLYHHYVDSKRDRKYYEVVSTHEFVLNYYPDGGLLTVGGDSGWGPQFKNVDEKTIENLVVQQFTFGDLANVGLTSSKLDSILTVNIPRVAVKSNADPDLK